MSYFPKPSLNENDLAIIERGATAAHSIEAGQYVSWHGRTGRAKAAILQGATLDDTLFDYDEDGVLNASVLSGSVKKGSGMTSNSEWLVTIPIPANSDINTLSLWIEMVSGGYPVFTFSAMTANGASFYVKNVGTDCTNVIAHWSIRQ